MTVIIEKYAIYASNSTIGYAPVTKELADALKQIVKSLGDEIAKGDALEFTYNADLSPAEQGVDSVDLVTLTITLDWAE